MAEDVPAIVALNVGGKRFVTSRATLTNQPGSMLAAMFSGGVGPSHRDETGAYFIDRAPNHFGRILNFMRDGSCALPADPVERAELRIEARFFRLEQLEAQLLWQVPTTLEELAELVGGQGHKQCSPGMVLDLGGRTLGGELRGKQLVVQVPGLVLRNGTLALPLKARVVVAAADVRLEELTFKSARQEPTPLDGDSDDGDPYDDDDFRIDDWVMGTFDFACVLGLVVVEGAGRSVALERCTFGASPTSDYWACVAVGGGASARLSRTALFPDGHAFGLMASGAGSTVALEGCTVGGDAVTGTRCKVGLVAAEGAVLQARDCDIGGCFDTGVVVKGTPDVPGSRLALAQCRIHAKRGSCVSVEKGAVAALQGCTLCGEGYTRHCLLAGGAGSTATATDCGISGSESARAVVQACKGARVVLEGATQVASRPHQGGQAGEWVAVEAVGEGSVVRLVGGGVKVQGRKVGERGGLLEHA